VTKASIQFRLTASYTLVLALTFALIGVGVWVALNRSIDETADRELYSRLADVRRYVDSFSANDLMHLEAEFQEESLLTPAVANIRIADKQGRWLFRTPGTEAWPALNLAKSQLQTIRVRHELIRILIAPIPVGVVEIGLPIGDFEEVKQGFLWLIGLGSPVVLLLAWLGGYWMSGRALRPVDKISRAAERINSQDLSARLPANGAGDELDRLSAVLNGMLARLQSTFRRIMEFTADASHELRTPVAVIQTTAELMQARPRTVEEHIKAWRSVSNETQRTAALIDDLLTLARADAGKVELEFQLIDFSEVVRTAADQMRVIAETKGLVMELTAIGTASINGDAEALRRAICILLDNAIKFTSAPGRIDIQVQGSTVKISDNGVGIAAQDLDHIFERFFRVSKDRSRLTGGTGLGLSILAWIVERHGGRIQVNSLPGKGSDFTISLPPG